MDFDVGSTGPGKLRYGFSNTVNTNAKIERESVKTVIRPIEIYEENEDLVEQFSALVAERVPLPIIKNVVSSDETRLWSLARKTELVTSFYKIMERHYRK